MLELLLDEAREALVEGREILLGGIAAVLEDPLVAGGAGVARLDAAELPDDPVRRLDPAVDRRIDLRVLLEDLERLRELPLRRDPAAVPREPRLVPRLGQRRDPVGLLLRGVVPPELGIGVRPQLEGLDTAERRAVGEDRQGRGRGEVGRDSDDVLGIDAGRTERRRHGVAQHVEPVVGILQGPRRWQLLARARQFGVDHAVRVFVNGGPELLPVRRPDDERSTGERSEVDADDARRPRHEAQPCSHG